MIKTENLNDFEPSLGYQYRLDVVNCTTCKDDIKKHGLYVYPFAGSTYKHKPSKYFGIYSKNI